MRRKIHLLVYLIIIGFLAACVPMTQATKKKMNDEEYGMHIFNKIKLGRENRTSSIEYLTEKLGKPIYNITGKRITSVRWEIKREGKSIAILNLEYDKKMLEGSYIIFKKKIQKYDSRKELEKKLEMVKKQRKVTDHDIFSIFGTPAYISKEKIPFMPLKTYYHFNNPEGDYTGYLIKVINGKVEFVSSKPS